ncbi:DNA repair protein RadA [Mycobacterium talmoniae]|uniref:DNA repair protein RadA n=1 Tax=Mycobacterium talmoniae TaxID=1858794 RepID=A0A2S8BBZ5_9MYCO|nr:DNA repair protein RadA [Mycobacterium talmoniae]
MALASATAELPLPTTAVVIGEVGLAGDLRQVSGLERRLSGGGPARIRPPR